jgi:hypothetical protein
MAKLSDEEKAKSKPMTQEQQKIQTPEDMLDGHEQLCINGSSVLSNEPMTFVFSEDERAEYDYNREWMLSLMQAGLKRMRKVDVAGIAREMSEPKWPSLDPESSDFTDGWNQAIEMCIKAFSDWSRSHLEGKSE